MEAAGNRALGSSTNLGDLLVSHGLLQQRRCQHLSLELQRQPKLSAHGGLSFPN